MVPRRSKRAALKVASLLPPTVRFVSASNKTRWNLSHEMPTRVLRPIAAWWCPDALIKRPAHTLCRRQRLCKKAWRRVRTRAGAQCAAQDCLGISRCMAGAPSRGTVPVNPLRNSRRPRVQQTKFAPALVPEGGSASPEVAMNATGAPASWNRAEEKCRLPPSSPIFKISHTLALPAFNNNGNESCHSAALAL